MLDILRNAKAGDAEPACKRSMTEQGSTGFASGSVLTLSDQEKRILLRVARRTLDEYLGEGRLPECRSDAPALLRSCATFVTLWRRDTGDLRGCRGESRASRPLIESVAQMTIASATDDPRFASVTLDEVPSLRIEISALTPMRAIEPEEVVVGRHGLMIVHRDRSGLLLPQVATSQGWDRSTFLRGVCRKAGLPEDAWRARGAMLYGFEVEEWGEDD
jgi:AmmeMemoRadiSam system protein A